MGGDGLRGAGDDGRKDRLLAAVAAAGPAAAGAKDTAAAGDGEGARSPPPLAATDAVEKSPWRGAALSAFTAERSPSEVRAESGGASAAGDWSARCRSDACARAAPLAERRAAPAR